MTVEPLSQRECEVITALGRGAPKKDIAKDLGVAFATVDEHLRRAYKKLGVSDKASAVLRHQTVHGICASDSSRNRVTKAEV